MVDISDSLKNVFNKWDARMFLLVSLLLQVLLIFLAPRRKRSTSKVVTFLIWSSYLLADWVAGFTLGLLLQSQGGSNCDATATRGNIIHDDGGIISTSKRRLCHSYHDNLLAFWAPFLLLHLGGPDNITAFSMEDNSLWPRHLVGLLFQVVTAVYVVLLSLPHNRLLAPTILMFLAGTIKYSERTVALYFAGTDVICHPSKGFEDILEIRRQGSEYWNYNAVLFAYELLVEYKVIITDRSPSQPTYCVPFGKISEGERAFKLIEWELSFVYDSLFTKATVVHTRMGYALRVLSSSLILAASILFFLSSKHDFMRLDVSITYILLAGAISLDILGYIMLIFSKWTIVRLKEFESQFKLIRPLIENIAPIIFKVVSTSKDWSGKMMQHNLMNACLHQISHFDYKLDSTWSESVTCELKDFILEYVKKRFDDCEEMRQRGELRKMLLSRGNLPLENMDEGIFRESVEVRFEQSVLTWHLATDLCRYTQDEGTTIDQKHRNLSNLISNYIVYLLFMRLSMIPSVANWDVIYGNTRRAILYELESGRNEKFKEACNIHEQFKEACNTLIDYTQAQFGGSVLDKAVDLFKKIKELEDGERWKKVAEVWADMLLYAANNCPGIAFAQSLSRGGELLTLVCFLLHHYCLGRGSSDARNYAVMC